jgi:hypothetical protein
MVVGCISCKDGLGEDFAFCTCGLFVVIWASGLELYICLLSCTIYYHQPLVPL